MSTAPSPIGAYDPVFLYSGFRSCSTWFWSKFRENPACRAYYEVFNEQLATLKLQDALRINASSWRSRHPKTAPYYLEFAELLSPLGGIKSFPAESVPGCRWIDRNGIKGPLSEDTARYIGELVAAARSEERVPVITCTRMLGLVHPLKNQFGGTHILLVRNLFRQWNSFCGQMRSGNESFLYALFLSMNLRYVDPFIENIVNIFPDDRTKNFENWTEHSNFDLVFVYFVLIHMYFYVSGLESWDSIIEVDKISTAPEYRCDTEDFILRIFGKVHLDDAESNIDFPIHPLKSIEFCKTTIMLFKDDLLNISPNSGLIIESFLEYCWNDYELFSFYTETAASTLRSVEADLSATRIKADLEMQEKQQKLDEIFHKAEAIQKKSDQLIQQLELEISSRRILEKSLSVTLLEQQEQKRLSQEEANIAAAQIHAQQLALDEVRRQMFDADAGWKAKLATIEQERMCADQRLRELEGELTNLGIALEEERRITRIRDMERQRLFSELRIEDGPFALKAALPVARALRPLINGCAALKKAATFLIRHI